MNWIIIPVYNRRETTLVCLRLLIDQGVTKWARILVVDDGSTDGTAEAVKAILSDAEILYGNGNLWWGGAMRVGMEYAWRMGADYIFWLNDDCQPAPGAMAKLLEVSREYTAIAVAPCALPETGEIVYGGKSRTRMGMRQLHAGPGDLVPCEAMSGNCVCIPRTIVDSVGFVDSDAFPHVWGDSDYGLRATAEGWKVLLVGDALSFNTFCTNKLRQSWLTGQSTVPELWQQAYNPQFGPLSRASLLYRVRHWGAFGLLEYLWTFTRLAFISLVRLILPAGLIHRLAGSRSEAQARVEAIRSATPP